MILDNKLFGILEQSNGHLVIYDAVYVDPNYTRGLSIIKNMGLVVDTLTSRAKNVNKKIENSPSATTATAAATATKDEKKKGADVSDKKEGTSAKK